MAGADEPLRGPQADAFQIMPQGGRLFLGVDAPAVFLAAGLSAAAAQPALMPVTAFTVFNEQVALTMGAIHPSRLTNHADRINTY